MRIGILCEGEKTDAHVFKLILEHRFPEHTFLIKGVTKARIFRAADLDVRELYEDGAERVLIIWDLLPVGEQMGVQSQVSAKPSRKEQRRMLLDLLCSSENLEARHVQQAQSLAYRYEFRTDEVPHPNRDDDLLKLVCICYTAEAWLLSDGRVLQTLATSDIRQADRWNPPAPDRCTNPYRELVTYFGKGHNKRLKRYNKLDGHNSIVVRAYIDQGRLDAMNASASFKRVVTEIEKWTGSAR